MLINTLRIDSKTCYSLLKHVAIFVTQRKDSKKMYWLFQKKY